MSSITIQSTRDAGGYFQMLARSADAANASMTEEQRRRNRRVLAHQQYKAGSITKEQFIERMKAELS